MPPKTTAPYSFGDAPISFGPIVLRRNDNRLVQHTDFAAAMTEATRLARRENDAFAVYVPVRFVKTEERPVTVVELPISLEATCSPPPGSATGYSLLAGFSERGVRPY